MKVIILIGVSGSGKDTWIRENYTTKQGRGDLDALVFSADDHFTDEKGNYVFKPEELGLAHGRCLRGFVETLTFDRPYNEASLGGDECPIIINNTNTTVGEIAPYAALAFAYGCEVEFIFFDAPVEVCVKRNTHNVLEHTIRRKADNINALRKEWLPHWGKPTIVKTG